MLTHSLCTVPVSIVVLVRQQNEHIVTLTVQALSNNNMREATELTNGCIQSPQND